MNVAWPVDGAADELLLPAATVMYWPPDAAASVPIVSGAVGPIASAS